MKKILLTLLLLAFAFPAYALTGRVLYIVCDKLGAAANANSYKVNVEIARTQEVQGWKYNTCVSSDTAFIRNLRPRGYAYSATAGDTSTGANYGLYDMAVMLNMPDLYGIRNDAGCATYGMPHFDQWIDRNSARAFPIPLLVPFTDDMYCASDMAKAYTGADSSVTLASLGYPFKDANGDSLYILHNGSKETIVPTDSSWVKPLVWRHVQGRIAQHECCAACWMTVGSGSHRIIWMPSAMSDLKATIMPMIFSMFTKAQPIELPIIVYGGRADSTEATKIYTGKDTLQHGAGFKRVKDYDVANGMKLDLSWYFPHCYTQNVTANKTTAAAYATAFPNNIRLTMNAMVSWTEPPYPDMKGSESAATYAEKVARIGDTQDGCATYYPIVDTSRLDSYDGVFSDVTTHINSDSTLMALAHKGITDIYDWWSPSWTAAYPLNLTYHIVGPKRIWVDDAGVPKEMRFHALNSISRYFLQGAVNHPDSLKKAYMNLPTQNLRRATFLSHLVPRIMGIYVYGDAASNDVRSSANTSSRYMALTQYSTGIYLPSLTFSGGGTAIGIGAVQRAAIDSTHSVLLNVMADVNNMKKMGDYLVATYGTTGQSPFIWAWLDEVKWDRRNGRQFPNSHVRME